MEKISLQEKDNSTVPVNCFRAIDFLFAIKDFDGRLTLYFAGNKREDSINMTCNHNADCENQIKGLQHSLAEVKYQIEILMEELEK